MTSLLIGLAALVVVAGVLLGGSALAVRAWQRRHPDPAWHVRAPVQKFTGFDQEKAVTAKRLALDVEKSKRKLAATRSAPTPAERDSRHSKVVRIEKIRRAR